MSVVSTLDRRIEAAAKLLAAVEQEHSPAVFASSLGAEDMVVLDLIARDGLDIRTFTLDTGRLPRQTHDLIAEVRRVYGIEIQAYVPRVDRIETYVRKHGIDGFYEGVEQRKACCYVRKVQPLQRALRDKKAWITGLRREQAASRAEVEEREYDAVHGLWKYNPLAAWSEDDVWRYIRERGVPYNALHDRGYPSIGCEPCTRAVKPGEDPRAGRWWWEREGARKECGLHEIPIRVVERT